MQFHSYWKIFELIWIILNFLPIEMEGGIMYLFSIEDPFDFKAFKRNPGGGAGGESKILGVSWRRNIFLLSFVDDFLLFPMAKEMSWPIRTHKKYKTVDNFLDKVLYKVYIISWAADGVTTLCTLFQNSIFCPKIVRLNFESFRIILEHFE